MLPTPLTDGHGRPVCDKCGAVVRPQEAGVWVAVIGWTQNRTGGGAHAISERQEIGVYRHNSCHKYNVPPQTETLFDTREEARGER